MMTDFSSLGRMMMVVGALFFLVGLFLFWGPKIPYLGRLPSDLFVQRKGFSLYFPVVTCVVLSILATLILHIISRR